MNKERLIAMLAGVASLALAGVAYAQQPAPRSFMSVSPVFEEADLDAGGKARVGGVILRAGTATGFGEGNRAGVTLNYDYFDWSFDNPTAFGGVAPWNIVQRYGFNVPLTFALRDGWSVGVTPSMDWFLENGAKASNGLVWGATFSAVKRFGDEKLLGLGLGAFEGLEETRVFPFPIVNWRFDERWRLINPLVAGPTGPAGLELDYMTDSAWRIGFGGAWRRQRFALSEGGPVANGIGQVSGAPIYLRASRQFAGTYNLNLYAGVVVAGELRVEDANGDLVRKDDFGVAPLVGFNVTARF